MHLSSMKMMTFYLTYNIKNAQISHLEKDDKVNEISVEEGVTELIY